MIGGDKGMIAGCIQKLQERNCGTCERKHACASIWTGLSELTAGAKAHPPEPAGTAPPGRHPVLTMLGGVAELIELRTRKRPTPVSDEVERRLEPMLARGQVGIEEVARALGYSRQTLYRRLKEEGATFEALLDRLRRRLAGRHLKEGLTVKDVAYRLGFSDPAAFSRAYKRWTGRSPTAAR